MEKSSKYWGIIKNMLSPTSWKSVFQAFFLLHHAGAPWCTEAAFCYDWLINTSSQDFNQSNWVFESIKNREWLASICHPRNPASLSQLAVFAIREAISMDIPAKLKQMKGYLPKRLMSMIRLDDIFLYQWKSLLMRTDLTLSDNEILTIFLYLYQSRISVFDTITYPEAGIVSILEILSIIGIRKPHFWLLEQLLTRHLSDQDDENSNEKDEIVRTALNCAVLIHHNEIATLLLKLSCKKGSPAKSPTRLARRMSWFRNRDEWGCCNPYYYLKDVPIQIPDLDNEACYAKTDEALSTPISIACIAANYDFLGMAFGQQREYPLAQVLHPHLVLRILFKLPSNCNTSI